MKGWRNSRRERCGGGGKERPEAQKAREEKANAERAARAERNENRSDARPERQPDSRPERPQETVREMKAERAATRIGGSREGRGQTDPRARRAGRMQEAPETTDQGRPGKDRAVPL